MKYKLRDIKKLTLNSKNPRTHTTQQISRIAASIQEFGFINPIIINEKNNIIAGHGRLLAAQKLGRKRVPVLEVSHLTEAQRRGFVIADNRLAENGSGWNDDILRLELTELSTLNFDIELTGFSEADKDFSEAMAAADEFLNKDYKSNKDTPEEREICPTCGRPL